uniref:Uncharacterized protein n=1 Tax=Panagrolaimus sp. ES5 TaxID=591445 RepID=A0AC34GW23_9BILA
MNLLGVQQNSASRPSLFSSIWSIQVQTQNEVNDFPLRQTFAGFNSNEIQPGSRNAISLSELPSSSISVKTAIQRSSTCPILTMSTFEGCLLKCSKESFCGEQQRRGNSAVTRQQKNRNICEWLQKVSGTEPLSETSSITFLNDNATNQQLSTKKG